MNAAIHSDLADSGLFLVGNQLNEESEFLRLMPGEDDDAHVEAMEEWYARCMCCCCTGECRDNPSYHNWDDDEPSLEEVLSLGFVEGDLNGSDPYEVW